RLSLKKWHWPLDIGECRTSQLNSGIDNLFMIAVDIKHYSLALNLSVTFRLGTHNYDNGVGREKTTIGYSSGRSSRGRWLPVPKQYYRE
ncbi:hypothetical protein, partial [Vibrio sp. 1978]|uniref:hypothetical protein n=1 Tax=Vibrio sp. 1978 TaxID=3074585 RepID=UPI002965E6C8